MTSKTGSCKIITCALLIITISGCAKYQPNQLAQPFEPPCEKEGISIQAHRLNKKECKKYFDSTAVEKKFVPIQLNIKNDSNQTYKLYSSNIGQPVVSKHDVTKAIHRKTTLRVILHWLLSPVPLITGTIDGIKSYEANKEVNADVNARAIDNNSKVKIPAGATSNKVMFVSKDGFAPSFKLTLIDKKNNKIPFNLQA